MRGVVLYIGYICGSVFNIKYTIIHNKYQEGHVYCEGIMYYRVLDIENTTTTYIHYPNRHILSSLALLFCCLNFSTESFACCVDATVVPMKCSAYTGSLTVG